MAVAGLAVLVFAIAVGVLTAVGASTKQSSFPLGGSGALRQSPTAPRAARPRPRRAEPDRQGPSARPEPADGFPDGQRVDEAPVSDRQSVSAGGGVEPGSVRPTATPSAGAPVSPTPPPATVP